MQGDRAALDRSLGKGAAGASAGENDYERATKSIEKQIETLRIQAATVGMTTEAAARYRAEQQFLNAARDAGVKLGPAEKAQIEATAQAYAEATATLKEASDAQRELTDINNAVRQSVAGLFTGFRDELAQGKDAWDAFKDSALRALGSIEDKLIELSVNKALEGLFPSSGGGGILSGLFGAAAAEGMAFDKGRVLPFARGGIIERPAVFPLALAGEAGPEAILPLKRGSDGRLGVSAPPFGGGPTVNNFYVSTPNPRAFGEDRISVIRGARRLASQGSRFS